MSSKQLVASTPGRICLFGEHQDYLGLPVITAAINLRISISAQKNNETRLFLDLPDIHSTEEISLHEPINYQLERDYLKSAVKVLQDEGYSLHGLQGTVRGNIPINSGTSSSSALVVTWIGLLLKSINSPKADDAVYIARLAHRAEVLEFNEPGGMMDHFATACGHVQYIDFQSGETENLANIPGAFVLGDSQQPKDTKGILARVKDVALSGIAKLEIEMSDLTRQNLQSGKTRLTENEYRVLSANIINKELTQQAKSLFQQKAFDCEKFGKRLTEHQQQLRDGLHISTEKIDNMIEAALQAGALGAKINGSGGGGCMFAYAPNEPEKIKQAIENVGGKAWIVQVDKGLEIIEKGAQNES